MRGPMTWVRTIVLMAPWLVGGTADGQGPASRLPEQLGAEPPTVVSDGRGRQHLSDVDFGAGSYLVAWRSPSSKQILGRFLDRRGEPQGDVFEIAPTRAEDDRAPSVVFNPGTDAFYVVWADEDDNDQRQDWDIFGRRVPMNGPLGFYDNLSRQAFSALQQEYDERDPDVGRTATGELVVVFDRAYPNADETAFDRNVELFRLSADETVQAVYPIASTEGSERWASVSKHAGPGAGSVVCVVWHQQRGSGRELELQAFDVARGEPAWGSSQPLPLGGGQAPTTRPDVAGTFPNFVVAFERSLAGASSVVVQALGDAEGAPVLSPPRSVGSGGRPAFGAAPGADELLLVFERPDPFGQRVAIGWIDANSGAFLDEPTEIAVDGVSLGSPSAASAGTGRSCGGLVAFDEDGSGSNANSAVRALRMDGSCGCTLLGVSGADEGVLPGCSRPLVLGFAAELEGAEPPEEVSWSLAWVEGTPVALEAEVLVSDSTEATVSVSVSGAAPAQTARLRATWSAEGCGSGSAETLIRLEQDCGCKDLSIAGPAQVVLDGCGAFDAGVFVLAAPYGAPQPGRFSLAWEGEVPAGVKAALVDQAAFSAGVSLNVDPAAVPGTEARLAVSWSGTCGGAPADATTTLDVVVGDPCPCATVRLGGPSSVPLRCGRSAPARFELSAASGSLGEGTWSLVWPQGVPAGLNAELRVDASDAAELVVTVNADAAAGRYPLGVRWQGSCNELLVDLERDVALELSEVCECEGLALVGPGQLVLARCGSAPPATYTVGAQAGQLEGGRWSLEWVGAPPPGFVAELAQSSGSETALTFSAGLGAPATSASLRLVFDAASCNGYDVSLSRTIALTLEESCDCDGLAIGGGPARIALPTCGESDLFAYLVTARDAALSGGTWSVVWPRGRPDGFSVELEGARGTVTGLRLSTTPDASPQSASARLVWAGGCGGLPAEVGLDLLLTLESACPCEGVSLLAPEEVSLSDCGEGFFPLGISATAGSPGEGRFEAEWVETVGPPGFEIAIVEHDGATELRVEATPEARAGEGGLARIRWSGTCNGLPLELEREVPIELELDCPCLDVRIEGPEELVLDDCGATVEAAFQVVAAAGQTGLEATPLAWSLEPLAGSNALGIELENPRDLVTDLRLRLLGPTAPTAVDVRLTWAGSCNGFAVRASRTVRCVVPKPCELEPGAPSALFPADAVRLDPDSVVLEIAPAPSPFEVPLSYEFRIARRPDFEVPLYTGCGVVDPPGKADVIRCLPRSYGDGIVYWQARAIDAEGQVGPWSPCRRFCVRTPGTPLRSDLNGDGRVDGADLFDLADAYRRGGAPDPRFDLNGDRLLDAVDFDVLLIHFGARATKEP